jgi:prepilin-type N-terminal cleavage/methylation domain-containing protein
MNRERGFSLVEILVALTVLLLLLVGVLTVFVEMMKVRKRTEVFMDMQRNVRFAQVVLGNKFQITGYETLAPIAFLPDPPCPGGLVCPPERAPGTDGVILMVPVPDRVLLRPHPPAAGDCPGWGDVCPGCFAGIQLNVCTPSGLQDNELGGQSVVVCGVTSNGVDCLSAGGWVVPQAFLPSNFLTSCGVATGDLCCVPVTVQAGPQCGGGGTRNADGRCPSGWEVLTVDRPIAPNPISNTTNALCQVVLPVEVLHYQVHQLPDPSYPHPGHLGERRFLVVRRNDEVDNAGNPLWVPVASDIEDLQICYEVQRYSSPQKGPACDPPGGQELGCFRWTWNPTDLARPKCPGTGQYVTIADLRRAVIQITGMAPAPVSRTIGIEQITCADSPPPPLRPLPPPPQPIQAGPLWWRTYTVCTASSVRNLMYRETTL